MTTATVVLAAYTALDVDAARRLADYGELDDAAVARALEQVHMQRWGRTDLPGHLCRIEALAAVVDDGRTLSMVGSPSANERERLSELLAVWPADAAELVDWSGAARALLAARTLAHDMVLPQGFSAARSRALGERVAPAPTDHPAPEAELELDCLRLMAGLDTANERPAPAARAIARYRLWLRWQYVTGALDADDRAAREARLAELQTGASA